MSAHISAEKRAEIEALFKAGKRQFEVEKISGCAKGTVKSIRDKMATHGGGGVAPGLSLRGTSTLLDRDGNVVQQWVKTKADNSAEDVVEALRQVFDGYSGKAASAGHAPGHCATDLLTVYNIADHHLGLYAWARETGVSYDLDIGERVLLDAMRDLVAQTPNSSTGIVLNLGDFYHADNSENKTARSGNVLDVDTRYAKVLQVGVKLMISCIEMALGKHAKVIVRCLPGNHDAHTALALSVALSCFFSSNERVFVDLDPSKFFWHRHGLVMIGATHGDAVKPANMPGVMAAYQPSMWGNTHYRYAYLGHIHHRAKGGEENGVIWETFQSLAAKDAWHHGAGYSSGRSMVAITHHRNRGEIYRHTVTARLEAA